MKTNTVKNNRKYIDDWRNIYPYVIPTFFAIIYIIIILLIRFDIIVSDSIVDSDNINNLLEALITFVSIVIGIFGFLLPILITNKKDCGTVEFFMKKADKRLFIANLKTIIISGFIVVIISALLFLSDIFLVCTVDILLSMLIWFITYFMCNSYRFISLLLLILITEKEDDKKPVKSQMSEAQIAELNKKLKSNKNRI